MRRVLGGFAMTEECKWGKPTYTVDGKNVVIMQGFKEYFALGFFQGALLKDPKKVLVELGQVHAGRVMKFQARLRRADVWATEELPVPLCRSQTIGDTGGANRKGDAGDIRRQRVPGETLDRTPPGRTAFGLRRWGPEAVLPRRSSCTTTTSYDWVEGNLIAPVSRTRLRSSGRAQRCSRARCSTAPR